MVFPELEELEYEEEIELPNDEFAKQIEKESSSNDWMYADCWKCGKRLNLTNLKETRIVDEGVECKKGCRY